MNHTLKPNELFSNLQMAASMVLGAHGSIPAPEDLARLHRAIINIEATIQDGKFQLECVHRNDLKRIQKLLKKGIKRTKKQNKRLEMECE